MCSNIWFECVHLIDLSLFLFLAACFVFVAAPFFTLFCCCFFLYSVSFAARSSSSQCMHTLMRVPAMALHLLLTSRLSFSLSSSSSIALFVSFFHPTFHAPSSLTRSQYLHLFGNERHHTSSTETFKYMQQAPAEVSSFRGFTVISRKIELN